jgi:CheY-like chemotaxis protein
MPYILAVEDDTDSRDVLCQALSKMGHEVACVSNGREALMSILTRAPDLVVLDLLMPEMDGPSLLEVLRSYLRLQSLPVIILTALPDGPLVDRARHLKVNAILVKGKATFEEIGEAIHQELHRLPH